MEFVKVKILEFQTKSEAERCLYFINQLAVGYFLSLKYSTVDEQLIGKNAATKEDAINKAKTKTWAIIQESPDGTFYFTSLTGTDFEYNRDGNKVVSELASNGFEFVEKSKPDSWNTNTLTEV